MQPKLKENANFVKVTYFLILPTDPPHACSLLLSSNLSHPFPSSLWVSTHLVVHFPLCSCIYILVPQVQRLPKQRPTPANKGGMVTGIVTVTRGIKGTCSGLSPLQVACFSSPQPPQEVKSTQFSKVVRQSLMLMTAGCRNLGSELEGPRGDSHLMQEQPQGASRIPLIQVLVGSEYVICFCVGDHSLLGRLELTTP